MATDNKKAAKPAARKVKDKWKAKEWYKLYAPKMFNQVLLGETPSSDPANLLNRGVDATVHDLTGDFSKMHVLLKFKVSEVRGFDAHTVFVGQDLTSDYIRRLTRRKRTKTDHVIDVRTKDGYLLRIKPMSITEKRIQSSQETAVRTLMTEELNRMGAEMALSDMVKSIITGEMAKRLSTVSKVIVPIKRVEIRKTEVLEMGVGGQDTPIVSQVEEVTEETVEATEPSTEATATESEVIEEPSEEKEQ
ncbi:MAG: 30S ribosomal protein S3ae [Methanomassiliicoccales archaeon]|nr:MAG: 30S ribosomal protein S3ae [Methanomassiliicoccales archaeon]